ncbi:MBL fold metallo-hydrolase [Marimonas arenosa]|uniref:MBL fold metallo-hydrolase n=1 Tax=Marimonas arenosa TaxID=1795305 RepID=A0AAE3WEF0_9RHOB|nr:MBL fold metallo-hydrolase [Marimonas arenosa]MDQ2091064.1 MBL fold metallo-hydrolase [Marimonas arenosa]
MEIQQIRNATLIIEFAGKRFLVDPMLSAKDSLPPFAGTPNDHKRNPLVELPIGLDDITNVDAVIVTHTHLDHWDGAAADTLPKTLPLFVQHEADAGKIREAGFTDIRLLSENSSFDDIALIKTPGQHGSDEAMRRLGDRLGEVCGVVFRHPAEETLYLAGDTVWNDDVADNLSRHAPGVVILNCGDAQINGIGSIIMGRADLLEVSNAAPRANIVATHMEAVNHAVLTRQELKTFAATSGIESRVHVPNDGETLRF